jgi:hypothetical protein
MCHLKAPPNETITDEAGGNLDLWVHVRWQNLGAAVQEAQNGGKAGQGRVHLQFL